MVHWWGDQGDQGDWSGIEFQESGGLLSTRWHQATHTLTQRNISEDLNKGIGKFTAIKFAGLFYDEFLFSSVFDQWISPKIYFNMVYSVYGKSGLNVDIYIYCAWMELFINTWEKNTCFWCKKYPWKNWMTTKPVLIDWDWVRILFLKYHNFWNNKSIKVALNTT